MGQAVLPKGPQWSAAHKGLCLYVSRLIYCMWEHKVVVANPKHPDILNCRLSKDSMQVGRLPDLPIDCNKCTCPASQGTNLNLPVCYYCGSSCACNLDLSAPSHHVEFEILNA